MDTQQKRAIWSLVAVGAILQTAVWLAGDRGLIGHGAGLIIQLAVVWGLILLFAGFATRRIDTLAARIQQDQRRHRLTLTQMEQMEAQNAILQVIAGTPDVALAFQVLARRLQRIVKCDRVGLALLSEDGRQLQTFTARVGDEERRNRPRPEMEFGLDRSLVGQAVREREPVIVEDVAAVAPDYFDANVVHSAGFRSALFVPLISNGRGVGTINLVSRNPNAFRRADADALAPIAEILAVAHVAQQSQLALARYRTVEAMSELTLSSANEINSALQIIIGHCDLLERSYPDPSLQRDLATIVRQAQRIAELLERMRVAAAERLREVAASVDHVDSITS